ncbi:MAG: GNAT family N-acetyltransferase [Lachnospiraceae bacterium]|nr:GNAT family N-acetyltransferase [Lachnospiraceae bacterium]
MEITRIVKENAKAFEPLLAGLKLSDHSFKIGAVEDGIAVGVCLFNYFDDALMLEYIYVLDEYRRRGIATSLITGFLKVLSYTDAVSLHVNYPEKADDLHAFFLSMGFKLYRDGTSYSTPVAKLLGSKVLQKLLSGRVGDKTVSITELKGQEVSYIREALDKEDLDPGIISDSSLSGELSLVSLNAKTGRPEACVLCERAEGQIVILYLVNFTHDPGKLIDILSALKSAVLNMGLEEDELLFVTMTDEMQSFVKKLAGDDGLQDERAIICGALMLK